MLRVCVNYAGWAQRTRRLTDIAIFDKGVAALVTDTSFMSGQMLAASGFGCRGMRDGKQLETGWRGSAGPLRRGGSRSWSTSIDFHHLGQAATRDSTPLLVVKPADDRCIRLRWGRPQTSCARQPSDVGSIGLSALRTPGGLVGRTAPGWNSGMPGSQSSRAACNSASTLAEASSRLALPNQPHVQRAWILRRSRTTTTMPRPLAESPIVARSPPSVVFRSPGCSAEP
jgi:hypothetical protein